MYTHPVKINWKDEKSLLQQTNKIFFKIGGGLTPAEYCKAIIQRFVENAAIFADEPYQVDGIVTATEVTIHFKEFKIPHSLDERRPLTVTKVNGRANMILRPDLARPEALILLLCPHNQVPLTIEELFDLEVTKSNAHTPLELALAS